MQVPIFKIFVGWRPKKLPKDPFFFFGLEGTLAKAHLLLCVRVIGRWLVQHECSQGCQIGFFDAKFHKYGFF